MIIVAVSLYKGLRDVTRGDRVIREQNEDHFRISIENVDPSDSGTYWMVARNEHGTDRAFVTITVSFRFNVCVCFELVIIVYLHR